MRPSSENAPAGSLRAAVGLGLLACVLYGFAAGIRGTIGVLLAPLASNAGVSYADASLSVAVMQIVFGASQPVFGMLAQRRGNRFVLVMGAMLVCASCALMPLPLGAWGLTLSLGILFGCGAGALAFGLILASATRLVGKARAMLVAGMLNASAGLGTFVLAPTIRGTLDEAGLPFACALLAVVALALVPMARAVTSADKPPAREDASSGLTGIALLRGAFRNRTFLLLVVGFSTCGFHMVLIEAHLFSQYVSYGIPEQAASWAFSLYGIATIIGALLSGWLSSWCRKNRLLGFYYGFRALWVLAFLFLFPKTLPFVVLFSLGLGLTGDATVSPTSGLVNGCFPLAEAATLTGVLFLFHQIGAFASSALGGLMLQWTGGYAGVWVLDAALCVVASAVSLRIREA